MSDIQFSEVVHPNGGRLCVRAMSDGFAIVGILHLPADFVPVEGNSYGAVMDNNAIMLANSPTSIGLPKQYESFGLGDLLTRPIWNKTKDPSVFTVRFIGAFPEDNVWTVYGASHHSLNPGTADHTWFDVDGDGLTHQMTPPFDAAGESIGGLLNQNPVWPNKHGVLHTLPQLQTPWRHHYHTYHEMLVKAARNPEFDKKLEETIRKDPILREISMSSIDRDYCRYLARLDQKGMLKVDAPQSLNDFEEKEAAIKILVESILNIEDATDNRVETGIAAAKRLKPKS